MYSPYYNYASQKKKGIEELYKTEEKPKAETSPIVKKTEPPQKKKEGFWDGFSSFFEAFREDDIILAFVFLAILNEGNEEDAVILVILALLFFT